MNTRRVFIYIIHLLFFCESFAIEKKSVTKNEKNIVIRKLEENGKDLLDSEQTEADLLQNLNQRHVTLSSSSSVNSTLTINQQSIQQSQPLRNVDKNRRYDNCGVRGGSRCDENVEKIAARPPKPKRDDTNRVGEKSYCDKHKSKNCDDPYTGRPQSINRQSLDGTTIVSSSPSIKFMDMQEPTHNPIISPTTRSTTRPAAISTRKPTTDPTSRPTSRPTSKPTSKPTTIPTISPTPRPTSKPTTIPTIRPTPRPTPRPTTMPTISPTANPTISLSASPTLNPTLNPTANPTFKPTFERTLSPTLHPTFESTLKPTVNPTHIPIATTTITPSQNTKIRASDTILIDMEVSSSSSPPLQDISFLSLTCKKSCLKYGKFV